MNVLVPGDFGGIGSEGGTRLVASNLVNDPQVEGWSRTVCTATHTMLMRLTLSRTADQNSLLRENLRMLDVVREVEEWTHFLVALTLGSRACGSLAGDKNCPGILPSIAKV